MFLIPNLVYQYHTSHPIAIHFFFNFQIFNVPEDALAVIPSAPLVQGYIWGSKV